MRIAVFDSGVGGLTVLADALRVLPREDFLYYADTDHVPYGTRPKEEVRILLEAAAVHLIEREGAGALVVACNTATSSAIGALRQRYAVPIIGMEPAVKPALANGSGKRILVAATPLTLREEKFRELVAALDADTIVDPVPLPELVAYAERGEFSSAVIMPYLKERLGTVDPSVHGALVLGCTHFLFYRELFRAVLPPTVALIDGNEGTVRQLRRVLAEKKLLTDAGTGSVRFLTSGRPEPDDNRYRAFLDHYQKERCR